VRAAAPDVFWVTDGHAEGDTNLNAFDNALIAAGVGQWNLVKLTSVAPQHAVRLENPLEIEAGSVVPAVLSSVVSSREGERITACIGIGLSSKSHGMIMEHAGAGTPDEMEHEVRQMVHESFMRRGLELETVIVRSVSHTVEHIGSCVAAVVLWWR
jgi:arginine decarboxylase